MKTLFLIRHAKSSWDNTVLNDFDRPLNERGKKNAPEMAKRLIKKKIEIDLFVSSPAERAKKTAELFSKEFSQEKDKILFVHELYHAAPNVFNTVISHLDNKYKTVAVFAHNPGITEFANLLTEARIDNMPTCSIFAVRADIENWDAFRESKKEFLFFDYPKSQ